MSRTRFRIRSVMIAIAVVAVLLVLVRVLTPSGLEARAGIQESNLLIFILVPEQVPEFDDYVSQHYIINIPVIYVVALVTVVAAFFGLAVYCLSRWRRGSGSVPDHHSGGKPQPDQSGEPEGA